jgi:hypothetical protein
MQNLGGFTKIFMKSEEQFEEYRKYYDFSMEVYNNIGKSESFPAYQKPMSTPTVFYNSYFDEVQHKK